MKTNPQNNGYILHTLDSKGKIIFLSTDEMAAITYHQNEARIFSSIEAVTIAGAELEQNNGASWKASANGDYLHGDKVRIKLATFHHICKSLPSEREKLTAYNEGIVESTRWTNIDGHWLILAEITITIKTPGRSKNQKIRRVTCTQSVDIPHLLTAATIISLKANRAGKYKAPMQKKTKELKVTYK